MKFRIIGAAATVAFLVAGMAGTSTAAVSETYKQLNLFGDVFERVRADYVEDITDSEVIEAAINGMLSALDPHSAYMNPEIYKEMQIQTRGEFGGLGLEVTMENGLVKVIAPIDDTPAARAGLQTGDLITHLDNEAILGLTLNEAVEKMRGPVNSTIALTIARKGAEQPFEVSLTRAMITVKSVRHRIFDDIGYIRITSFNEQAESGLEKSMAIINEKIGHKMKGLVLDLRNNPGGLLSQAVAVTDAFLNHGEIVSTRGRKAGDIQRYNARRGDLADGKPLVVLINGGSASASEIVAGALQDHRRAVVLGVRSFGKGSVQTIIPLGGNGALRLTTARYYTPSGRSIQAKGIEPDIVVEQVQLESVASSRPRRNEASLRGHLTGEEEDTQAAPADGPSAAAAPENDGEAAPEEESEITGDYQLSYAADLLRGMALMAERSVN